VGAVQASVKDSVHEKARKFRTRKRARARTRTVCVCVCCASVVCEC